MSPDQGNARLRGVTLMLFAVGSFSLMDAGLKWLAPHYPPLEIATLRGATSLPLVLIWIAARGELATLLQVRWPLHLLRGALAVLMMATFTYGLRSLPLATAYALFFIAPLLITVLAGPLLGERIGFSRWLAIVAGFIGVLVVLRPGSAGLTTLAGLAVLVAAAGYAVSAITVRVLARSDSTGAILFWLLALLSAGSALLAAPGWVAIHSAHVFAITVVGLCGALGQWAITRAFSLAEASVLAPLEYTALLWGLGLDYLLWRAPPDRWALGGGAIVIAGGLYLLRAEARPPPGRDDLDGGGPMVAG